MPEDTAGATRAVPEVGRDRQLAAAADLHADEAVAPTGDHLVETEADRFVAVPRCVELIARLLADTDVVHGDHATGLRFRTLAEDEIGDDEVSRCGLWEEIDFRLLHTVDLTESTRGRRRR